MKQSRTINIWRKIVILRESGISVQSCAKNAQVRNVWVNLAVCFLTIPRKTTMGWWKKKNEIGMVDQVLFWCTQALNWYYYLTVLSWHHFIYILFQLYVLTMYQETVIMEWLRRIVNAIVLQALLDRIVLLMVSGLFPHMNSQDASHKVWTYCNPSFKDVKMEMVTIETKIVRITIHIYNFPKKLSCKINPELLYIKATSTPLQSNLHVQNPWKKHVSLCSSHIWFWYAKTKRNKSFPRVLNTNENYCKGGCWWP